MKVKIEGYVYGWHWSEPNNPITNFGWAEGPREDSSVRIALAPFTVEVDVEVPDGAMITANLIKALEEEKKRVYEDAARTAARLEDKIQSLLALTNEVQA